MRRGLALLLLAHLVGGPGLRAQADSPAERLDRAYALLAEGDVDRGRSELLTAASTLTPSEATPLLRLSRLLATLSPEGADIAARVAGRAHRGRTGRAVSELTRRVDGVPAAEQPPLLAFGARLSAADGDRDRAAELWHRIATQHPESREWPEAVVRLAELRAASGTDIQEAQLLLEDLIVSQPRGALTPAARRVLARLQESFR